MQEDKKHSFSLSLIKKGTDPELKTWVEMKTVNDIFEQACKLNKKQRKKMFKEFANMNEVSVLYKKACDDLINDDSKIKVESFKWCDD